MIGLIVLAAGASTRLAAGTPKQLLRYEGRSLLRRAAETSLASVCRPIIVVTGAHNTETTHEVIDLPVIIAHNERWRDGMSASIAKGLTTLEAASDQAPPRAVVLMLCDQPFVSSEHINMLVTTYLTTGKPIVASSYADARGVPALFDRRAFPALMKLQGDRGARALLAAQSARDIACVPFQRGIVDIDTVRDYEDLTKNAGSS